MAKIRDDIDSKNFEIYNEKNEEITERSKSLRELGFGSGAIIKYDYRYRLTQ